MPSSQGHAQPAPPPSHPQTTIPRPTRVPRRATLHVQIDPARPHAMPRHTSPTKVGPTHPRKCGLLGYVSSRHSKRMCHYLLRKKKKKKLFVVVKNLQFFDRAQQRAQRNAAFRTWLQTHPALAHGYKRIPDPCTSPCHTSRQGLLASLLLTSRENQLLARLNTGGGHRRPPAGCVLGRPGAGAHDDPQRRRLAAMPPAGSVREGERRL